MAGNFGHPQQSTINMLSKWTAKTLGKDVKSSLKSMRIFGSIGDEHFKKFLDQHCPKFMDDFLTVESTIKKSTKSKDSIRLGLTQNKLEEQLEQINIYSYQSDNADCIAIILIVRSFRFIDNVSRNIVNNSRGIDNKSQIHDNEIINLRICLQKFLNFIDGYRGQSISDPTRFIPLSDYLLYGLKKCNLLLQEKVKFDLFKTIHETPKFFLESEMDKFLSEYRETEPFDHQKETIETLLNNHNNGVFIVNNAMLGTGKTSMVLMLAMVAKSLSKTLLCVCDNEVVRKQMISLFHWSREYPISYGTANLTANGNLNVVHPNNQVIPLDAYSAIVCAPKTAYKILSYKNNDDNNETNDENESNIRYDEDDNYYDQHLFQNEKPVHVPKNNLIDPSEQFILFHDEPMLGADNIGSVELAWNTKVLSVAPKLTIFSTATAPNPEDFNRNLSRLLGYSTWPERNFAYIKTRVVPIWCEIWSPDGLLSPFYGVESSKELEEVIEKILEIPFISRMIGPSVLYSLILAYKKFGSDDILNDLLFDMNNFNITPRNIVECALQILEKITHESDDVIKKICSEKILVERPNFEAMSWVTDPTSEAMSLHCKIDPFGFAEEICLKSLTKSEDFNLSDFSNFIAEEVSNRVDFDNKMKVLIKKNEKPRTIKFVEDKEAKRIANLQLTQPEEDIITRIMEIFNNPLSGEVEIPRSPILMILLAMGIGIIARNSVGLSQIDGRYKKAVRRLAETSELKCLIIDDSVITGMNYPIDTVEVDDEFIESHSIMSLFQYLGRAGRPGCSLDARAYVTWPVVDRILEYIKDSSNNDIEVQNFSEVLARIPFILKRRLSSIETESETETTEIPIEAIETDIPESWDD